MDIQQPQLYHPGMGGGGAGAVQSRFLQDVYRAVKCPNFAMSKTTYQDCSHNAWTNLTWNYEYHNHLNCFDTANNRCAPMGVPGYYLIEASVHIVWPNATDPTALSEVKLGIWDASDVRVTDIYTLPLDNTYISSSNRVVTLKVSALEYLSGLRFGTSGKDYKFISLHNASGQTVRVLGQDEGSAYQPRFQAFKISY